MRIGRWGRQIAKNDGGDASDIPPIALPDAADHQADADCSSENPTNLSDPYETEGSAAPKRWVGFIDRVTLTGIEGWAFDTQNPSAHVMVEAVTSKGKKSVAVAHLYRKDVEEAGYGDGMSGFFLDLSKLSLANDSAIVRFADSKELITREPIEFDPARAVLTTDMPSGFFSVMGLLAAELRQAWEAPDVTNKDASN